MQHPNFGAMQQQMFDQFHQTMMVMFEGFAALHRETSAPIREEFDEFRKLNSEFETLLIASLRVAPERLAEAEALAIKRDQHWQRVLTPITPGS